MPSSYSDVNVRASQGLAGIRWFCAIRRRSFKDKISFSVLDGGDTSLRVSLVVTDIIVRELVHEYYILGPILCATMHDSFVSH